MRAAIITLVLLVLAGCSSPKEPSAYDVLNQPANSPKGGMAQIVLYYPYSFFWAGNVANIEMNGTKACGLKSGTFFITDVAPGPKTALAASVCGTVKKSGASIITQAGKRYYVRITPTYDKTVTGLIAQYELPDSRQALSDPASPDPKTQPFVIEVFDEAKALEELQTLKECRHCF